MSGTLGTSSANVRHHIHDTRPTDYAITSDELYRILVAKSLEMAGEGLPGLEWSSAALTTTANNPDASFSASVQAQAIVELRRPDGERIVRLSEAQVEAMRDGQSVAPGKPDFYYLRELTTTQVKARFYPTPDAAYAIDALMSASPAATFTAATVLPYSAEMVQAIEYLASAECLAKMTRAQREARTIEADVAAGWLAAAERLMRHDKARRARLMRSARRPAWVS